MDRLTRKLGQEVRHKLAEKRDPGLIALAHRTVGEIADIAERLYPGQHDFELLDMPLSRRQVICAFMSGLDASLIDDPAPWRALIGNCSNEELTFIRFHGFALETQWDMQFALEMLQPGPLPRTHYDLLATMIAARLLSPRTQRFICDMAQDSHSLVAFLDRCAEQIGG